MQKIITKNKRFCKENVAWLYHIVDIVVFMTVFIFLFCYQLCYKLAGSFIFRSFETVKIWLGVFVCCFHDSQCSWKIWLFRKKVAKCDMSVILKIGKEYFSKPLKALISWKKKTVFSAHFFTNIFKISPLL